MTPARFILASASPQRLRLLQQAGFSLCDVIPAHIDETPLKAEAPDHYALRMAKEKAAFIAAHHPQIVVLAADTVVACGRRILPKAENEAMARRCLQLLSGRRHRVYSGVCVRKNDKQHTRLVLTHVRFQRLTASMIDAYIASGEWKDKAGGYAIQGQAEIFIPWINGSYSNIVGLPLAETVQMLKIQGL